MRRKTDNVEQDVTPLWLNPVADAALDNNLSKNALRIMSIGRRKSFLWVGNDVAGGNLAALQAVVATRQQYEVNSYEYIKDVLIRIQTLPKKNPDNLLPMIWEPLSEPESIN